MYRMGIKITDQKGGPSGWKFADGTSNKLARGTIVPEAQQKRNLKTEYPSENGNIDGEKKKKKRKTEADSKLEKKQKVAATAPAPVASTSTVPAAKIVNGVEIVTVKMPVVSNAAIARAGNKVKMHYVGKLQSNNKVFDSSSTPFVFKLGAGDVIRGWDIGIAGMKVGEKRILTIPPEKGYGARGAPPKIPSNATLVFDVTLMGIL